MTKRINLNIHEYMSVIFIIVLAIFCYNVIKFINVRFKTDNITKTLNESEFIGYAIFINKKQLLTTYDLTENTCKKDDDSQYNLYILYNDNCYHVINTIKNAEYGLSILEINTKMNIDIKNYALISNNNDLNKLYTVKSLNEPFKIDLSRTTFKKLDRYLYGKSIDVYNQKQGSPLFDSNMSLYGIVLAKTKSNVFGVFTNNIIAMEKNYIKSFLDKYKVDYKINSGNINLNVIDNYENKVTAKVICVQKTKRIPKTITLQ